MLRTEVSDVDGRASTANIMLMALKNIPLTITVDPVTEEDTWHPPKKQGELFKYPKRNGKVLIKRGLAQEID